MKPETTSKQVGIVRQLWRYPVSSLMGETLTHAPISQSGIAGDRVGAFFDALTHEIASPPAIRKWNVAPQMAARTNGTGDIEVTTDGYRWQTLDDPSLVERVSILFGRRMSFRRYGDHCGDVLFKQRYPWKPIHIISTQALSLLQSHLAGRPVDVRRFRPNIVADLPGLAGERPEYDLIGCEFTIAGLRMRGLGPSGRCAFTTLTQRELPEDRAVLRALIANFEKDFGIYCEVLSEGNVAEGDNITLEDTGVVDRQAAKTPAASSRLARRMAREKPVNTSPGERTRIGSVGDFPPNEIRRIEVAGAGALAVGQDDGAFFAVSDRCPHAGASMSEGFVEGGRIICPLHFAEFDLNSGQAFSAPPSCRDLRIFTVVRENDDLYLSLSHDG